MLLVILSGCLGLQALPGKDHDSNGGGDDSNSPVQDGALAASADHVDFGDVPVDATVTQPLTLSNTGGSALGITASLTGSSRFSIDVASMDLAGGDDTVITVSFAPDLDTAFSGALAIEADNGDAVSIALAGTGTTGGGDDTDTDTAHGDVTLSTTSLAFGNVDVGDSSILTAKIDNDGGADLVVSSVTTSDGAFTISGDFATSRTLKSGESKVLSVTFAPTVEKNYNAHLTVASNDPDEPSEQIAVTGTGASSCSICAPVIEVDTGGKDPYAIEDFNTLFGPDSRTITVTNAGDEDLDVDDVVVNNDWLSTCGTFTLSGWKGAATLKPGGSTSFKITYVTTEPCIDVAQDSFDANVCHIFSNDPGQGDYVIALGGIGF